MQEPIKFRKQRDLGEILSDTFKFIRQEWKPLSGLILKVAGPALIAVVLAYVYYMQSTVGSMGGSAGPWFASSSGFGINIILSLLLFIATAVVYYCLLVGTILSYIKSYVNNNNNVDIEEVKASVRSNFWSLVGLYMLVGVLVFLGALFCLIPGIYLGVVLATTFSILIFEKRDVTDSISYSFNLIKNEWWITFATFLVMGLIYYVVLIVFQIPQYIYFFVKNFTIAPEVGADPADMFDWVYVALSSIGVVAQYLLQSIMVITSALIYYNLNEKKNFTGTLETIESIGNRDQNDA